MNNVNEIVIRYHQALLGLSEQINKMSKGDWSKADLLVKNDNQLQQFLDEMNDALSDFEHTTSAGNLYQLSDEFISIAEKMSRTLDKTNNKASITLFFEYIRDDWEEKADAGDVDREVVDALDFFFSLPNYAPDDWLRRKFMIRGARISPNSKKIPKKIVDGFSEACACFIYGQNLATCALARSVMETALKNRFDFLKNMKLGEIIHTGWHKIHQLKEQQSLNTKADNILQAGNDALHSYDNNKTKHLFNEFHAISILNSLREIIEFLYA